MSRQWIVEWTDGSVVRSSTATQVIAEVGALMWQTHPNVKKTLSEKAWQYFRVNVDEKLEDAEFLKALQVSGLIRVLQKP
jgi:hypothetical protein